MSKFLTFCILLLLPLTGSTQTASFSAHNAYTINSNYIRAIGDLNNDGYQDLVIFKGAGIASPSFSVLLSNGDGTYRAPITYALPTGSNYGQAVLADFNGDGKLDLVVPNSFSTFYIYLGNGDGTFRAPVAHTASGQIETIAAADVNGDSKTDLLVVTSTDQDYTNDLYVFLSNGDGTFSAGPVTYNIFGGPEDVGVGDLLTGDFNGDGKTDIAVTEGGITGYQLEIWLGDGTGNFKMSYSDSGLENFQFIAADLNGDGISDVIATANNYNLAPPPQEPYFTVYYGQSNGTVERAEVPITGGCPIDYPVVADFNGDGIPDIAFGGLDCDSVQPTSVSILFGKGNGEFGSQTSIYTFTPPPGPYLFQSYPPHILRGNRDTKADLVFSQQNIAETTNRPPTSNHIITLLNTTMGNFPTCSAPNAAVGINVCSPAAGSSVSSPVNFAIGASGDTAMRKVEVWADGKKQAEQLTGAFSDYSFFNNSIPLAAGSHSITVFAAGWDNSLQSKVFTLDVTSSSCSAPTSAGVHVCTPTNGATVSSPVQISAAGKVTGTLASMQVWVDGVKKYSVAASTINTTLSVAAGTHRFAVLAVNTAGQVVESTSNVTVQ
jgi:hypothetical protein